MSAKTRLKRLERLERLEKDVDSLPFFILILESDATEEEIRAIEDEAQRAGRSIVAIDQEVVDDYRRRHGGGS